MAARSPRSEYEQTPSNLQRAEGANPASYLAKIVKATNEVISRLQGLNPDAKHNQGKLIGEMYLWDEIAAFAAAKSKALWEKAETEGIVKTEGLEVGPHVIAETPHFTITAEVTNPVRRFNPDALATWMFQKHKIPIIVSKEQIDKAKVPTKSQTRLKIIEK